MIQRLWKFLNYFFRDSFQIFLFYLQAKVNGEGKDAPEKLASPESEENNSTSVQPEEEQSKENAEESGEEGEELDEDIDDDDDLDEDEEEEDELLSNTDSDDEVEDLLNKSL